MEWVGYWSFWGWAELGAEVDSPLIAFAICKQKHSTFQLCPLHSKNAFHAKLNLNTYRTDDRKVENLTDDGYPPEEVDGDRKEAAEENDEAVAFNDHANERPAEQDDRDASKECYGSFGFVPLKEEPERPLQADHKCQAAQKENLGKKTEPII